MSTEKLDPRNYCGGKVPDYGGDGYSDWRGDYDPKEREAAESYAKKLIESAPDYIKQAIADREQAAQPD